MPHHIDDILVGYRKRCGSIYRAVFVILKKDFVMKMKKRHQQKLIVLSLVLFFLLNVPFKSIFVSEIQVLGFPAIYLFIFLSWFIVVLISYQILKRFYE